MDTPTKIVASQYVATVFKGTRPTLKKLNAATTGARVRLRWRAEFVGGPNHGLAVDGFQNPDDAVGALIREAAYHCETADDVLNLVATLFGDVNLRTPDVVLARAVRFANESPRRRHAGCRVLLQRPEAAKVEGGAA